MIPGQIIGNSVIINKVSTDASLYTIDPSAEIYYEVVRMIEGKLLFLTDHLERLKKTLVSAKIKYPGDEKIIHSLKYLISESQINSGNIKISLSKKTDEQIKTIVHFVTHFYPDEEMYENGVNTLTYKHTRNHPGIKKWDNNFRRSVNDFIVKNNIYEAILTNEQGFITEGSRSNIFFISREKGIYTAPSDEILEGITRKYVIEIIRKTDIPLKEKLINGETASQFESCFITGTSPKVLPVRQMDQISFKANNSILKSIMHQFNALIRKHLLVL